MDENILKINDKQFTEICRWIVISGKGRIDVAEGVEAVAVAYEQVGELQSKGILVVPGEAGGSCFAVAFLGKK